MKRADMTYQEIRFLKESNFNPKKLIITTENNDRRIVWKILSMQVRRTKNQ